MERTAPDLFTTSEFLNRFGDVGTERFFGIGRNLSIRGHNRKLGKRRDVREYFHSDTLMDELNN